jgi:2-hydroxychromene-2-carboxylate isomerase
LIDAVLYTDPGCPWAYSANPDIAVLRWRFGDGLRWRIATIGLTETPERYLKAGYTPARQKSGQLLSFRPRFGMPFSILPRERVVSTGRACRAIVATRLQQPQLEWAALRALQFGWFCTPLLLDEDEGIGEALSAVPGLDARAIVAAIDDPAVEEAYESDRAEARTAAGTPAEAQGKTATSDGPVRYTAPSVVFATADGSTLEAGGFQSIEAYDVCVANLEPSLPRREPAADPLDVLAEFDHGLTTQEVAAVMAPALTDPDRTAARQQLIELAAEGKVSGAPIGDDVLWRAA